MAKSSPDVASLYQPLSSEDYEIRLLTLLPGSSKSSIISCTLTQSSIDDIEYEALSYTWGDPTITETILVNGIQFEATTNLVAALRQLRSEELRTLWVDAVCINQANDPAAREERAVQVRRMKEIYSEASSVIAWLGPEDESSKRVFDMMDEVRRNRSRIEEFKNSSEYLESKEARDAFFARPYWGRVWVVQEIAMNTMLWVQCGPRKTLWDNLQAILPQGGLVDFTRFRNSVLQHQPVTLLEALYGTRSSLATMPVDKVHAVLGLASDGHQIIPRPTYKKSIETVLTDMTKIVLMKEKCLDLITLKRPVPAHAEMPSWVPDWTELSKAIGPGQERHISSSRDADINLTFIGDKLRVQGRKLHVIINATSSRYEGIEVAPMIQSFQTAPSKMSKHAFWALLSKRLSYSWTYHSDVPRYANAICTPEGEKLIRQRFPVLTAWLQANKAFTIGDVRLESYFEPRSPEVPASSYVLKGLAYGAKVYATPVWAAKKLVGQGNRGLKEWYNEIDTALWDEPQFPESRVENFLRPIEKMLEHGIKLVVTTSGIVGLAPARTQRDDQVCFVDGCSVPVVLRSRVEGFEVIGEAWFPPSDDTDTMMPSQARKPMREMVLV